MQDNLYTPYIIRNTAYVNNSDVSSRFDGILEEDTSAFKPYIATNKIMSGVIPEKDFTTQNIKLLTGLTKNELQRMSSKNELQRMSSKNELQRMSSKNESYSTNNDDDIFISAYNNTISENDLSDKILYMINNINYINVNDEIVPERVGRELLNRRDNLGLFTPLWELMKQDINGGKLFKVKQFIKTLLNKYDGNTYKIHDEYNGDYIAYAINKSEIFLNRADTSRILTGVAYQMVLLHELTHAGLPNISQHPLHFQLHQSILYAYAYMYGIFTLTDIKTIDDTYGSPTYLISAVSFGLRILYLISQSNDTEWREQLRLAIDQSNIYLCGKNDDDIVMNIIKRSYWHNLETLDNHVDIAGYKAGR